MKLLSLIKNKTTTMTKVIQSNDPDIDTFKCPKCKAIWREKWRFDFDGEQVYGEDGNGNLCPHRCIDFFGFRITGKRISNPYNS